MAEDTAATSRQDLRVLGTAVLLAALATAATWALGGRLASVPHVEDAGASWYFWQTVEPSFAGRASAWGLYLLHQLGLWAILYAAVRERPKYTTKLHRYNWWALGLNAVFVVLHLVQTHLWYDGLAIDVSIWSSFGSVAVLLIWVLLMESPRRGIAFGKKLPVDPRGFGGEVLRTVKRHHGWYFCWAITYTFWYHPAEGTGAHLVGFSYIFLLFIQGSLFFTRVHTNRWWTLFLEVFVVFHGAATALQEQGSMMAMMFGFGFLGIFVITQMHGLGWSRAVRAAVLAVYLGAIGVAAVLDDISVLGLVPRIPVIDYLGVAVLFGVFSAFVLVSRRLRTPPDAPI